MECFFSTVSQTAGAIVGIFAAFLITKIVANQSEFSMKKERTTQFLLKSAYLENETKVRKFDWYNDRIADQEIEKIVKMADETKEILIAEQYYKELNFSPFQSHLDLLKMIQQKLMSFTRKNALKKRKNALKKRILKKCLKVDV